MTKQPPCRTGASSIERLMGDMLLPIHDQRYAGFGHQAALGKRLYQIWQEWEQQCDPAASKAQQSVHEAQLGRAVQAMMRTWLESVQQHGGQRSDGERHTTREPFEPGTAR